MLPGYDQVTKTQNPGLFLQFNPVGKRAEIEDIKPEQVIWSNPRNFDDDNDDDETANHLYYLICVPAT